MSEEAQVEQVAIDEVPSGEMEQPQEVTQERPDWLPEKFERPEELANSYQELERAFYSRKDQLRQQIISEINEEAVSSAPISPADYDIPEVEINGMDISVSEDDPMLGWFKEKAHSLGMSQSEFDTNVKEFLHMQMTQGPDWNVESEALGEYADKRLERVDLWADKNLSEEAYAAFAGIPASAAMVQLFEELMELNGQPQFNMTSENQFQERLSKEDLMSMQNDPKYWKDKDPAFIAKVRAGFAQYSRGK
jgi:hypothetical protein